MGTVYINNVVKQMKTDLRLIQELQPLIHNITNYVAMNFVANSLLAIGASPIMARAEEEVEEISSGYMTMDEQNEWVRKIYERKGWEICDID